LFETFNQGSSRITGYVALAQKGNHRNSGPTYKTWITATGLATAISRRHDGVFRAIPWSFIWISSLY